MYPIGELNHLAARKALLRVRIAEHRLECMQHGAALARPLQFVDRALARWRQISPIAKMAGVPIVMMLVKKFFRHFGKFASVARMVPMVLRTARMVSQWRA